MLQSVLKMRFVYKFISCKSNSFPYENFWELVLEQREKATQKYPIPYYRDYPEESLSSPNPAPRIYQVFKKALRGVTRFSNILSYLFEFSFHEECHQQGRAKFNEIFCAFYWRAYEEKKDKKVFRSDLNIKKCQIITMYWPGRSVCIWA